MTDSPVRLAGCNTVEIGVSYQVSHTLYEEWLTFNTHPDSSRFRAATGAPLLVRPLWHAYQPHLIQPIEEDGEIPHSPGALPLAPLSGEAVCCPVLAVDRGGACFDRGELGFKWPFYVSGSRLFSRIGFAATRPATRRGAIKPSV